MPRFDYFFRLALVAAAALLAPIALRAQTTTPPKVFSACYVPNSGTVYRIKEDGLPQDCTKSTHVQFSWTDGAGHLSEVFTVTSEDKGVAQGTYGEATALCPTGSQLVGGGYTLVGANGITRSPTVAADRPSVSGTRWLVALYNTSDIGTLVFRAFARCAK